MASTTLAEAIRTCPSYLVSPVVGSVAGNPGAADRDRSAEARNKMNRNKVPALHEAETSELQAIVGGHLVGPIVGNTLNNNPMPSPRFATQVQLSVPAGNYPVPDPWLAAAPRQ
jgi:hypothetical protein